MVSNLISIPGYYITEELYNGSRTLVYRGYQETDSLRVVIKLLKNPYPSFSELVQFRNQYTIAKNLNLKGIIHTYSLEPYKNSYILVMEDFGGISLKDYFANNNNVASLDEFLQIAISLCDILDILYRQRIIHKDIKPSNILINPETKQIKLIDFSIASLLPREIQTLISPNVLEGTLAYISPEQTGRMNRGIDYRTDFYSLGVTFYELLTGKLPFKSNEPIKLVHDHIAKQVSFLADSKEIPQVISDIVIKLMAKNAEDRYQSAFGLKYDLENCFYQLKETGKIEYFKIAQRDICDRFIIPDKLYGRETEIENLLKAFDRVSTGTTEMMLVAGFSGIGKTVVVNEIHKPIIRQRGYFIKGKYDQFNRNIPFSAFVQAFRNLMGQLLTESDAQIQQWKTKILEAVGENGQVIVEVTPELEKIIGTQPPAPELSGTEAQNRFNLLFQKFTQVFTSFEHPLVIFLDDLQWADSASLKLMQLLMADTGHLLLIGAYRDNEVNPAHPLMLTLSEIQKTVATINTIILAPLNQSKVNQLVAETLKCTEVLALPLSQLVYQKTQGNPFFATQFLKALHQDGLIKFDFDLGCWQCDIAAVTVRSLTSDVVEFMALQLQKLPKSTQEVLKLAACIGNQFDLANLAIVSEKSEIETAADLWTALQEGLILPQSEVYKFYQEEDPQQLAVSNGNTSQLLAQYKFLHDRVQQAAYFLIAEEQKQATHLKIGRQLWHNLSQSEQESQLFTIVNHLNVGRDLIIERSERDRVARLNLQASQKAQASVAYETSRRYCYSGQLFMSDDSWKEDYSFRFELAIATIKAEYFNHNLQVAQQLSQETLEKANTLRDRIKIHELQILFKINENKMNEAICLAIDVLALLDITLPKESRKIQVEIESLRQEIALPTPEIAHLILLDVVNDEDKIAAIRILTNASSASYIADPNIYPAIVLHTVLQCMKYGHSPLAASAYSWYGALLCGVYNEIDAGYEFGKLSLQLLEKFNSRTLIAKVTNMFNVFIRPWKEHLQNAIADLPEAIQSGFDNGDVEYAFYAAVHYCNYIFYRGIPLEAVQQAQQCYLPVIIKAQYEFHEGFLRINQQVVANLLGETEEPQYLQGSILDGETSLSQWLQNNLVFLVLCFYEAQTRLAYLFEDYMAAVEAGEKGWQYRQAAMGTLYVSEHNFYYSLALLANGILTSHESDRVAANQNQLKIWAKFAPSNFQHKYDLVEAERYRILGEKTDAIEQYDRAIALAKENGYIQEEALANELAAKFYLDWGKEKVAAGYMQEAYYGYASWGAKAKVADLEKRYPKLLATILKQPQIAVNLSTTIANIASATVLSNSTSISNTLDLATVLKASQALSSEIKLEDLLSNLMQIVMENAGADKCALMLFKGNNLTLEITATSQTANTKIHSILLQSISVESSTEIPVSVIKYVSRTSETLIIDDAMAQASFASDSYLQKQQPKSILCTPIINQGKLIGILYLENNFTIGAFTRDRLQVLKFLTTQAAISLENAQLYRQLEEYSHTLEEKVSERTQQLQQQTTQIESTLKKLYATQAQLIQAEKMSGLGQLIAGIAHEINNPINFIYGNLKPADEYVTSLIELNYLYQKSYPEPIPEIEEKIAELELNFLVSDLQKLLGSMRTGAERIRQIVLSLRNFSRLDEAEIKAVDVHEGIDSTLLILQHRLNNSSKNAEISIIKEYSQMPLVNCYPSALNQVFMNILNNAIDALRKLDVNHKPTITIRTEIQEQKYVSIHIIDNGTGMSESVQNKIFEPFFTTKSIGSGTGLGLSISYSIVVEQHGGQLNCISAPGKGTEFVIKIPV
ncbi:GAF domain-containing protein [Nostoc sp. C052]|uniref:trifunctional serine/threonine-protein kinase/ATP-binding protein/sensor histidine kinase n=1 Tax=Nostoc sp. C052 TaxID=2576902 RepID=UPI0015C3F3ED|nr:ATP-binding sensor histidine kinase [Nostoc sp. C052]QLE39604.1 GAF domain-containing protein [Nostoc sp. C052]